MAAPTSARLTRDRVRAEEDGADRDADQQPEEGRAVRVRRRRVRADVDVELDAGSQLVRAGLLESAGDEWLELLPLIRVRDDDRLVERDVLDSGPQKPAFG